MQTSIQRSKILIIEDDPKDLHFLGTILQGGNYQLYLANDGEEGLKRAEKVRPDLILLDVVMPGLDGYGVCEKLKLSPLTEKIPVIFLSGKTETEDLEKGFSLGAVDFFNKPFNTSELLARIFTHLNTSKIKLELEKKVKESMQLLQIVGQDLFDQLFGLSEMLDLAKEDKEELIRNIPLMKDATRNAVEIVELIKDFIYLEGKREDWDLASIPLKSTIASVLNSVSPNFKNKNVKVNYSAVPDGLIILAHQRSLAQSVLPKLISNAYKFSLKDSNIDISAVEDGGQVILRIKDSGKGVPKDSLEEVFSLERKRIEGDVEMRFGLILVRKFINAYGGSISVESTEGEGFTVVIHFQKGFSKEVGI